MLHVMPSNFGILCLPVITTCSSFSQPFYLTLQQHFIAEHYKFPLTISPPKFNSVTPFAAHLSPKLSCKFSLRAHLLLLILPQVPIFLPHKILISLQSEVYASDVFCQVYRSWDREFSGNITAYWWNKTCLLCFIRLHLHYITFSLYYIYIILDLYYTTFTLYYIYIYYIYIILHLHYTTFKLYYVYIILHLHYTMFTLYYIYITLHLHYTIFTLYYI
jgi:hypothetical protein